MVNRRTCITFASAAVLVLTGVCFILNQNQHGDPWEKFSRVRPGMSKKEVIDIFGVPPGKYRIGTLEICLFGSSHEFDAVEKCSSKGTWQFDEGLFEIGFDSDLLVQEKAATANMSRGPTIWDRLRHILGSLLTR